MEDEHIVYGINPIVPISTDSTGLLFYKHFMRYPDDIALSDPDGKFEIRNKEVLRTSCMLALKLKQYHFEEDDVIGLCVENVPEFFYIVFGCLYVGITVMLINPRYTIQEFTNCLNIAKPKIVFCSETPSKILNQTKLVEKLVIVNSTEPQGRHEIFQNFIAVDLNELEIQQFQPLQVNIDEKVAFILFSSGTTGFPKGVCLTHKNINALIGCYMDPRYQNRFQGSTAIGVMPFFHGGGLFLGLLNWTHRKEIVILKSFNPETFLQIMHDKKIEVVESVPTIAKSILKSPSLEKYKLFADSYVLAGSHTSVDVIHSIMKRIKVKEVLQCYGLTEATFLISGPTIGRNKIGSCGQLVPYVSSKVVDINTGKTLKPLQSGELCFKGPMVMKGYKNNETATKLTIDEDGWLHSGDVGYYDHDGYLFFTDRLKELIKYKDFQVPPTELESILLSHPDVFDASVIGIPDEDAGELPLAFVVKNPNSTVTELDIQEYVAGRVSSQKKLRGGVIFLDELPRTASQKIMKTKLKSMVKSKL